MIPSRVLIFAFAFAALSFVGLGVASSTQAHDKADDFAVSAEAVSVVVGSDGSATIKISVGEGYKWNKEYPAKVTVAAAPKEVALKKDSYSQLAGDFSKVERNAAVVTIALNGVTPGETFLHVDTRFSICNDKVCLIKKASVDVPVSVVAK